MTRNLVNRMLLEILVRALGRPAGARLVGGTGRRKSSTKCGVGPRKRPQGWLSDWGPSWKQGAQPLTFNPCIPCAYAEAVGTVHTRELGEGSQGHHPLPVPL